VLGIYLLGPLLTDVIFIFVMHHPDLVPGGYWFLLLGPLVEGSLGGTFCFLTEYGDPAINNLRVHWSCRDSLRVSG